LKDIAGVMDRTEAFLIEAMSSHGSTFLSFVYAIFYFIKRRWSSLGSEVQMEMSASMGGRGSS
jgi:hypothetical protein